MSEGGKTFRGNVRMPSHGAVCVCFDQLWRSDETRCHVNDVTPRLLILPYDATNIGNPLRAQYRNGYRRYFFTYFSQYSIDIKTFVVRCTS